MSKKVYESMFIFSANAFARNPGNASNGIKEIVESVDGELLASRVWNEQKLAYPINGQRKGVYWLSYIRMDGEMLPKFNRACKLNDMIMRQLTVSIDPRLVDTLVSNANETTPSSDAKAEKEEKKSDDKKDDKKSEETTAEAKDDAKAATAEQK